MPSDGLLLAVFTLTIVVGLYRIARIDALNAGLGVFFLVYVIFALVGYRFFPVLSQLFNGYFGPDLFGSALRFVFLSFIGYFFFTRWLHGPLVGELRYAVDYEPVAWVKWTCLLLLGAMATWMVYTLVGIYPKISYATNPQIPDFLFRTLFKQLPYFLLLTWAFARRHAMSLLERVLAYAIVALLMTLFLLTALKASNRTDILALFLGLAWYELAPYTLDARGGLRPKWNRVLFVRVAKLAGVAVAALVLMDFVADARPSSESDLPEAARLLLNDYYPPAHILFAAMEFHFVQPLLVLKSNVANALMLGGTLDIPYLQTEIGNRLLPGSSSRSTGFALYFFAEGFMAGGPWLGILYNGLVPVIGLAVWRRLARTEDVWYNALVGALCAMSFATVARSGSHLIFRVYLFSLLPFLFGFRLVTGARMRKCPPATSGDSLRVSTYRRITPLEADT